MNNLNDGAVVESPYARANKDFLITKLGELERQVLMNEKKASEFDALSLKYSILEGARKEDRLAVENANLATREFQKREFDQANLFKGQIMQLQTVVAEQNQTILSLFGMLDNSINQQILYYNKFKEQFINFDSEKPKE